MLAFIGETCPRIQKLSIRDLAAENDHPGFEAPTGNRTGRKLFPDLLSLHLSGRLWNPGVILPLTLASAEKISKLSLMNLGNRAAMDRAVVKVLQTNKMSHVATISLCGCYLSIEVLRRIVFTCDKLTCFSFSQSETLELSDVDRLREEVISKNLDIKLCCLEMIVINN